MTATCIKHSRAVLSGSLLEPLSGAAGSRRVVDPYAIFCPPWSLQLQDLLKLAKSPTIHVYKPRFPALCRLSYTFDVDFLVSTGPTSGDFFSPWLCRLVSTWPASIILSSLKRCLRLPNEGCLIRPSGSLLQYDQRITSSTMPVHFASGSLNPFTSFDLGNVISKGRNTPRFFLYLQATSLHAEIPLPFSKALLCTNLIVSHHACQTAHSTGSRIYSFGTEPDRCPCVPKLFFEYTKLYFPRSIMGITAINEPFSTSCRTACIGVSISRSHQPYHPRTL
jgi:hypothetical protein